ncbi:Dor1-like family protein [Phlyctema vagabunda]|uniref:Conserved oligomeric Golgi complex subunit 8 n=1 Tax=Phlyctema vagabunda TaxID=108571 RepID=A0ABR4PDD5_9HELO
MADPLFELLVPYFDKPSPRAPPSSNDPTTSAYLNRLTTLPLSSLNASEPASLQQSSHSLLLSIQALSSRSHGSITESSTHLRTLSTTLPALAQTTSTLLSALPKLDDAAINFSETYNHRADNQNPVLARRKESLLLSRNVDRLADVLDLPTLLSSAISSSNTTAGGSTGGQAANYASALDLNAHIRRLHALYPSSSLVSAVSTQAEEAMQAMTTQLVSSLRTNSLKLASAMRTISWLRRVAPELDGPKAGGEGSLGALFLVCRLANLTTMLGALEPLRELADQETLRRIAPQSTARTDTKPASAWSGGQQTERYLKRYIEIFREQSFAIISMYRSIFPPTPSTASSQKDTDPLQPLPSALSTFPLHLIGLLEETLKTYLPNVRDKSSRDSLLTQVLYCAGSLGRLGGDFSGILALLSDALNDSEEDQREEDENDEEDDDGEWVDVIRKHRVLAGRLELMVGNREGISPS